MPAAATIHYFTQYGLAVDLRVIQTILLRRPALRTVSRHGTVQGSRALKLSCHMAQRFHLHIYLPLPGPPPFSIGRKHLLIPFSWPPLARENTCHHRFHPASSPSSPITMLSFEAYLSPPPETRPIWRKPQWEGRQSENYLPCGMPAGTG